MILIAYRVAAEVALAAARGLRAADDLSGGRLLPARWRLAERLEPPRAARVEGGRLWLHAASLGECKGLWAFARVLRDLAPNVRLVLTANTAAGVDVLRAAAARDAAGECAIATMAPLDHPRIAQRFLHALDVRAVVLFEVELWPHRIAAARRAGVPVLWISARLTERARRRYAGNPLVAAAFRRVLADIAWIQTQTEDDAHALRRLKSSRPAHPPRVPVVETGGDLRGLHALHARTGIDGPGAEDAARSGVAFISFHADELDALVSMIEGSGGAPLRVFPRKLEELARFRKRLEPLGFRLHSREPAAARRLVDSFGLVEDALRNARVAVIGGSFAPRGRTGGHNLWEPLLAGARPVIGPDHGNQKYLAEKLARAGLLRIAEDAAAAIAILKDRAYLDSNDSITAAARKTFIESERVRLARAAREAAQKALEHAIKRA